MDLIEFLNARLDEDKAAAWAVHDVAQCDALLYEEDMAAAAGRIPDCDCGYPARVLRGVEAGRAIVHRYERESGSGLPGRRVTLDILTGVLRDLATIWSDHPDYRPEWKP